MQRLLRSGAIQMKLTVNKPGDEYEQEADRVAETVMRLPDSAIEDVGTAATMPAIQRKCTECEEEEVQRKERPGHEDVGPDFNHPTGGGQALPDSERNFFESRFGQDFSHVRFHSGAQAGAAARSVSALAYTMGSDVVFGEGQYRPGTNSGRTLMAHELAHVVQQGSARAADTIQRNCNTSVPPVPPDCVIDRTRVPSSNRFLFDVNCDDFATGEEARLISTVHGLTPSTTVGILGVASLDGTADFNDRLSCQRAKVGAAIVRREAPSGVTITTVEATGGIPASHDPRMRAVALDISAPTPVHNPKCGPDATSWFVRQVNAAAADPAVRTIQIELSTADSLARAHGTTAAAFAEGGAATAIEAQEARLTLFGPTLPPPRSGAIVGQMAAGTASRSRALAAPGAAILADPFNTPQILADFAALNLLLASAAFLWFVLVNHRARYDFKAHTDSMHFPHTANCPEPGCPPGENGTITLCPTPNSENCYESDLPGNLFFAMIGRFVGFSETTLQLGSQLAELTDLPRPGRPAITFDTPDDTAAISLGFRSLPVPLTRSALCSALVPARPTLAERTGCEDCVDPTPSIIR
jgi:hypothetical protein